MRFRYRLLDSQGTDLGPFVSSQGNWTPGDTLPRALGGEWRVVAVVPELEADFRAYLVVEAAPLMA